MLSVAAPSSGLGGTLNPSPLSPPSKTQTTGRLGLRQKPKPLADSDVTVLNFEPATEPDSCRFGTVSAECVLIVYFQVTGTSPLRVSAPGSGCQAAAGTSCWVDSEAQTGKWGRVETDRSASFGVPGLGSPTDTEEQADTVMPGRRNQAG